MKAKFIATIAAVFFLTMIFGIAPNGPTNAYSETINLKVANYFPPPSGQSKIMQEFIDQLEARTDGKVKVRYFPGGALLKAPATIKGVESGIADIGLAHIEYTAGRFPVMEVAELPLGYPTGWVANQVMNDFFNKFQPKEFDNFKVLWWHANSPSVLITKKPVRTLEDLKGMTIRAPGRFGDVISALGGTPSPTHIMETYDAISKGVIDGVFTPYETLRTFKFAEVAKYVTNTQAIGPCYPFFVAMNKDTYEKLPPDVKEVLDTLAGEYRERMALMWNALEFPGKAFGASKGVEYIELSPEETARFVKAAGSVIDKYTQDMVSKGFTEADVQGWLKYIQERSAYQLERQKFYQIKSPIGPPEVRQ